MSLQDSALIDCPYCGETIELPIDTYAGDQDYIEDCQVCCKPINVTVRFDEDGEFRVTARSDSE